LFYFGRKYLFEASMKLRQDYGKLSGVALSGVQTMETLKANGNEADFFAKWSAYNAKYTEEMQRLSAINLAFSATPVFFAGLNTAMIMMFGGMEIMDGLMTAGVFIAFRGLMDNFQAPLGKMLSLSQSLQDAESQMQRLDDVLRYELDELGEKSTEEEEEEGQNARLTGKAELVNVTFGYSPLAPPLIENFSLSLKPGRWVALVGDSGCGKSTVVRLFSGLYKPWSGKILFDGCERKEIPRSVMVRSLACVDQDICLFAGTVRDNIALFDPDALDDDIMRGARDAKIHGDIERLEGGYDHPVAEGGLNFSGGQRQRLEIARAFAGNPSILLLDEATSALDPATEEQVMESVRKRGCACLMSAHRLSAFRDCDEIIVLKAGKVVQRGTHDEMAGADGPYRELIADLDA
jgi:ABC-type bacteriocin/lantibiotic exporter with double-glycine peptidase domain